MKNIHIIPTDKPSRLSILNSGKLNFGAEIMSSSNSKPQHIYITSDEEIKEGVDQWYLDKFLNKPYNSGGSQYSSKQDVIILTTDQDLIKDGVQAIDDEFLEWFVKNPSCEEVEVKHFGTCCGNQSITQCINCEKYNPIYKITIPQEEPKQETLNKINNMNEEIKKQINLLEEEQTRVKQFINENNFNCTTAPYVIAKQYRDEIKKHIGILKMNLEN
jgi:hypothetical protein